MAARAMPACVKAAKAIPAVKTAKVDFLMISPDLSNGGSHGRACCSAEIRIAQSVISACNMLHHRYDLKCIFYFYGNFLSAYGLAVFGGRFLLVTCPAISFAHAVTKISSLAAS
ncbi:hypothetical protein [Novosphingobium nitrogenifigens]|uniref:hypothetical protein n=1 Tax=Novosphingobium nitrogenifigens TaxID=378548 RepID=UPI00146167CA|nr:hypothetical protein [Novosphingobium nitrogenifigens]